MKFARTLAVSALVALSAPAVVAETVWQMPTPYPEANFHTQNIQQFAEDVETATDGELVIKVHPAGSLIKHHEIRNAVRSQQVQIGEFILANLANEDPIFALDSVPFMATSFEDARHLYDASRDKLSEKFERQGLKPLFSVPWPGQGLYTDRAIETVEDLHGLKMRAYSPQTERLAQLVGSVPTQVEVPDLAQAFTTGRVNAMITSTSTGVNTSAWDYLTHFYDVSAFLPKNIVVVNGRAFDALPPEQQEAVLAAAKTAEERGWKMSEEDHLYMRNILEKNGISVSSGSDDLNEGLHAAGTEMANSWAEEAGESGAEILKDYKERK